MSWEDIAELEAAGIRVESHGIGHRPLADLEVDEAAREITLSKLRLEDRLQRPVRAFAYVKGSEAHYRLVHLSLLKQAGYDVAFTSISGSNGRGTDPLQLHRYNVEPYRPAFELVLSGACDLIAVRTRSPARTRAASSTRRSAPPASELVRAGPFDASAHRDDHIRLLEKWGNRGLSVDRSVVVRAEPGREHPPGRPRRGAAGRRQGAHARACRRRRREKVVSYSCHAVTSPAAAGRRIFTAAATCSAGPTRWTRSRSSSGLATK
jgi:hypothetical protein